MPRQPKTSSKERGLSGVWNPSPRAAVLVLIVVTLLVHARALPYPFTNWDDDMLVLRNPQVQQPTNIFAFAPGKTYQPIRLLSYVIDYRLWGFNPLGYHLVNLLLHSAAVLLLWGFLRRWLPDKVDADAVALLVALLFAVHPVNVEAVSWIASRKYGLLAVFSLLAMHATVRGWAIPAALACGLAAMSSPFAIVLPLVLLALARRTPQLRQLAIALALVMAPIAYGIVVGLFGDGGAAVEQSPAVTGPVMAVSTMLRVISDYALNLTAPFWLSAKYPYDLGHSPKILLSLLLLGLAIWGLRRWGQKQALAGAAWALLWWAPVSNLVPTSTPMADRYLYLPGIGLFLIAALAVDRGLRSGRLALTPARAALTAYLLTLAISASLRVGVWADSVTLWTHTAARNPADPIVQSNLGDALESAKRGDDAEPHFRRAIEIWEAHPSAHLGLGTFLLRRNRLADAAPHLARAVELAPERARAWGNLGICRRELGDAAGAVEAFREAVARSGGSWEFHKDLGLAQAAAGDIAAAGVTFEALSAGTGENAGLLEAARLWSTKLAHARALPLYEAAAELAPQDPEALDGLGSCLLELGRQAEARTHLEAALAVAPGMVSAREHLGICHAAQGEFAAAETIFAALVQEHPQRARSHRLLAMAQRERNQFAAAASSMATAARLAKQPAWLVQAAEFAAAGGAQAQAAELAHEALRMAPDFAPAQTLLAKLGR